MHGGSHGDYAILYRGNHQSRAFEKTLRETPEVYWPLEGGIKGIDLHRDGQLLVTTCRNQTLRFFELTSDERSMASVAR